MVRTIWKYTLSVDDFNTVEMPAAATVLTVAAQGELPCLWATVNPEAGKVQRHFRTYGTGHVMPNDPGRYIGTYQLRGGALVFHVFEVRS